MRKSSSVRRRRTLLANCCESASPWKWRAQMRGLWWERAQKGAEREQVKWNRVQMRWEESVVGDCRWHEWNKEWEEGRERVAEREQTGSSEESVRWKRQLLALYLLVLFPGHIPWDMSLKYLMNVMALVHRVDSEFGRSLGSRLCQSPSESNSAVRSDQSI